MLNAVKHLSAVMETLRYAQGDNTRLSCHAERSEASREWCMKHFYVYIMTNHSRTLYTGVTNDLLRRVFEHKSGTGSVFTSKYKVNQLVYFETSSDIKAALEREKQIKGWLRAKKIALIESVNPGWQDLSADWYENPDYSGR